MFVALCFIISLSPSLSPLSPSMSVGGKKGNLKRNVGLKCQKGTSHVTRLPDSNNQESSSPTAPCLFPVLTCTHIFPV